MDASREIELEGHIIDSGIMTQVFDRIMDMEGNFEILEFDVGKRKTDPSYAKLRVKARDETKLGLILSELHRFGARPVEIADCNLVAAEGNRIAPRDFYSTTNHPTFIRLGGKWIPVEEMKMDSLVVFDEKTGKAVCKTLSKLIAGELVVVGEDGVKVVPPARPRKQSLFEFMHGTVSPERPSEAIIAQIAKEMIELRKKGGKIILVGGPAIIHTGASASLAKLIRMGYVDALLAGNALAAHDIEFSLMGTSLGMDLTTGKPVIGGHCHHLQAISEVIRAGSIRDAVEKGVVKSGVMYECVKKGIPYVLAGSIRDDGPLPDVITDVIAAQDAMREELKGCGMVLMVATLLHSIAVGNCLPSQVKTVCVDINPTSVTKLMDRGTQQVIGVVSDAGTFLPLLAKQIEVQSGQVKG